MKNKIQENIKKTDDNVYIFIDDLDRCNTNFVIKLFEITKHLFNIKNVVIIYMLDLNNINHSIIKYYNLLEDNNANETYLSKIIDYVHNLEEVDKTTYLLKKYDLHWIFEKTNRKKQLDIFINLQEKTFREQKNIILKIKNIESIFIYQEIEDSKRELETIIIFSIIQYLCEDKIDFIQKMLDSVIEQETFGNKIPREHNYSTRKNINRIISFFENIYKEAGIGSTFPYKNFSSINLTQFFKIDFKKLILIAINTG